LENQEDSQNLFLKIEKLKATAKVFMTTKYIQAIEGKLQNKIPRKITIVNRMELKQFSWAKIFTLSQVCSR